MHEASASRDLGGTMEELSLVERTRFCNLLKSTARAAEPRRRGVQIPVCLGLCILIVGGVGNPILWAWALLLYVGLVVIEDRFFRRSCQRQIRQLAAQEKYQQALPGIRIELGEEIMRLCCREVPELSQLHEVVPAPSPDGGGTE